MIFWLLVVVWLASLAGLLGLALYAVFGVDRELRLWRERLEQERRRR